MLNIGIFESIYKSDQVVINDGFLPFVHKSNLEFSHWREFKIHTDMYSSKIHNNHDYCGLFSPKFSSKCKIKASQFIDFCISNQDSDVFFINPFPQLSYLSLNTWMHAEVFHSGITNVAINLIDAAGIDLSIDKQARHGADVLAYSSFWCGNQLFWEEYVGKVLLKLSKFIIKNPQNSAVKAALTETFHYDPNPYLPFITERLFTTFISQNKFIKYKSYPLDPYQYCLNDFEISLVRNMESKIMKADQKKDFSSSLIDEMSKNCKFLAAHAQHYYKSNIHPHTGKLFT